MRLADLPTPAAVVDLDIVERNAARMADRAHRLGVRLRPHVKTHKCVQAARIQHRGAGLTVSTLAEARGFADAGFTDLTWAVPISTGRVREAVALGRRIRLSLLVDSHGTIDAIEAVATHPVPVFLKIDCGYHRVGVPPGPEAHALARRLHDAPRVEFRGLLTHAGHAYDAPTVDAIRAIGEQERDVTVGFARELRAVGIGVPEVSIGSTPTMCVADDLDGVTEIRPGNYLFFDLFQHGLGVCTVDDIALTVIASVIGRYPDRAVVDAGGIALSKDRGHGDHYGVVAALDGTPLGLHVTSLSQEHGKLSGSTHHDRVRIAPNHSCMVAAQHSDLYIARGDAIVDVWQPIRGW